MLNFVNKARVKDTDALRNVFLRYNRKDALLSSPLISLYYKSIKGVSYTRTNISAYGDCFTDISAEVSAEVR